MAGRFGAGPSDARDPAADGAAGRARDEHAAAFVRGADVTFSPGMYQPDSEAGRVVIAHELAHVVQQTRNPGRPALAPTQLEAEASGAAVDGAAVVGRAPAGSVQRAPILLEDVRARLLQGLGTAEPQSQALGKGRGGRPGPASTPTIEAQQRGLLAAERQSQLLGTGEGEGPGPAAAKAQELGELRENRLLDQADAVLQKAASGGAVKQGAIEALQQRLLTAERQSQLLGTGQGEGPGPAFGKALELGELRQRQMLKQADAVLKKAASGRGVKKGAVAALQKRMLTAERQSQLLGTGQGEGPGPAAAKAQELGELRQRRRKR
jgi:hypothetical protein